MMLTAKKINGLYIGTGAVVAVKAKKAGNWFIEGWAKEEVAGTEVKDAIAKAVKSLGLRGKISVSVPDTAVNVNILELEELPAKKDEAEGVIKWRLTRAMNQSPGRFDYQVLSKNSSTKVLAVSPKEEVDIYEDSLIGLGLEVAGVCTHSFNLANLLSSREDPQGDFSVIVIIDGYFAVMFFKNGLLDLYRCKPAGGREVLVREITSTFLFYSGRNPDSPVAAYLFSGEKEESLLRELIPHVQRIEGSAILGPLEGVDPGFSLHLLAAFGGAVTFQAS